MQERPDEQEAYKRIEKLLIESRDKELSTQDAAARSGVPMLESRYALQKLMGTYDCRLKVTEKGDLVYDFGDLRRRDALSFRQRMQRIGARLWELFTIFYKIGISAILVIYFIVFVLIVIGLIIAAMSSSDNKRGSSSWVGDLFFVLLRVLIAIFDWQTIRGRGSLYRTRDAEGYNYKHYEEKPSAIKSFFQGTGKPGKANKGFIPSIYDFVFGPPRVESDTLANQQELASFLRQQKGLVCIPEIQALAGYSRPDAERFLTRALADFEGEAHISENGSLYADFSEFIRHKNREGEKPIIYYWDEYEPEYELTGNSTGKNALIIAMNIFNLLGSSFFLAVPELVEDLGAFLFLALIPFVYSALFFIIPSVRYFTLLGPRQERRKNNIRKRLMRAIFQESSAVLSLDELTRVANKISPQDPPLNPQVVEQVMKDVIYDLDGDSFVDNRARIMYRFERLGRELYDVEAARGKKKEQQGGNDIVFDTGDFE